MTTYQRPLPLPATEPPVDLTRAIERITVMTCPYCGSAHVEDVTGDAHRFRTIPERLPDCWKCHDCGGKFDGWDHIPHPYQVREVDVIHQAAVFGTELIVGSVIDDFYTGGQVLLPREGDAVHIHDFVTGREATGVVVEVDGERWTYAARVTEVEDGR